MKQRFSSLDVKVIAHELSAKLLTLRVSNIFDLSSKIFLIKFAKPSVKAQVLIDSGFRCHLTSYSRATAAAPSIFVGRLRKYLKTRRVTAVKQVGTDRVLEFQFSDGLYRLFLEFYASGNVVLTDGELSILAVLRVVEAGDGQEEIRVGLKYNLENRQNYKGIPALTKERLKDALQKAAEKGDGGLVAGKKANKKAADALRKALAVSITEYPPMLVDHAMRVTEFDSSLKPADVVGNEALLDHLMRSLQEAQRVIQEITSSEVAKGFIIAKKKEPPDEGSLEATSRKDMIYEDFHPFQPRQFENNPGTVFLEFEGFNKTVDEFFSSIEGQKLEARLQERQTNAKRKLQAARNDQNRRLDGLQEVQDLNERKAGAVEANVERVQEAMDAVNGLIAQGMDWVEIGRLIAIEQKRRNPVAEIIKLPLKLEENTVTLLLDEEDFISDEDEAYQTGSDVSDSEDEASPTKSGKQEAVDNRLAIDINLGLSPWANARAYYDQKRSAAIKQMKTLQSSAKALRSTEAKVKQDLKKGLKQEKAVLRPVRLQMWFEKFIWFISSDGYLILGGKDAQQNEMLYRRYLRKGDVYVHADIQGAPVIVIRNNPDTPDAPIPPSTLSQAGTLAVACSTAWDSKAGMAGWWVNAEQVSKSAPTGEFLPVGSFHVRGLKNFLPPAQLLLGFGVVFQISDESKARHVKHRVQDADLVTRLTTDVGDAASTVYATSTTDATLVEEEQSKSEEEQLDQSDIEDEIETAKSNPLQNYRHLTEDEEQLPTEDAARLRVNEDSTNPPLAEDSKNLESDDDSSRMDAPSTGTQTPSNSKKGVSALKRGKHGKAKKIATKYKDQDEEDRLAAQKLIGAAAGLEKARAEAQAKAAREAELAFQKERRRAQHQRTQKETAAHEEARKMMLEEGQDGRADEEEVEKATALDAFVGTPLKGDDILEAIPVCAPWTAMANYKYKAKLQPGTVKKGKAVREILARWLGDSAMKVKVDESSEDTEKMWPREVELIKGWKVEEITNTVSVGRVRVMMAGGAAGAASKTGQSRGRSGKGSKKQR